MLLEEAVSAGKYTELVECLGWLTLTFPGIPAPSYPQMPVGGGLCFLSSIYPISLISPISLHPTSVLRHSHQKKAVVGSRVYGSSKTGRVNIAVWGMLLLGWLGQVGNRRTRKHGPAPGENDNSRQKLIMGMAYEIYD